jgi:hypothetical protein
MPAIQSDPGASAAALQWVLAGYGLAFGAGDHRWPAWRSPRAPPGLRLGAGALHDHLGRVRVRTEPRDPRRRPCRPGHGLGAADAAGPGDHRGQLIGGLLIDANIAGLDWRSCFLVNVPVGIAALVLTPRVVQESKAEGKGRLDLLGAVVVTAALVAIVLPLIQGREQGWPAWTWISLAIAPVLLVDSRTCSARSPAAAAARWSIRACLPSGPSASAWRALASSRRRWPRSSWFWPSISRRAAA